MRILVYDVLLTGDTKMGGSQNIPGYDIAVVVIRGRRTPKRLPALIPRVLAAAQAPSAAFWAAR